MTHQRTRRFRRGLLAVPALAALALAVPATAAFAGQTPAPVSSYEQHHQAPKHCEFVLLTGTGVDQDGQGQDVGYGHQAPSYGNEHQRAELVKAEQLVKVCEQGEHLTIVDVSRAYVQETEPPLVHQPDQGPSPSDYVTPAG